VSRVALLLVACGCGRLGFDEPATCSPDLVDLYMGHTSNIGRAADGSYWGFGRNHGALPLERMTTFAVPQPLPQLADMIELSISDQSGLGIAADHSLWYWSGSAPKEIDAATDWAESSSGDNWGCLRKTDGSIWTYGSYYRGNLGDGSMTPAANPRQLTVPAARSCVVGTFTACALTTAGELWCWGDNQSGSVGNGSSGGTVEVPVRIGSDSDWAELALTSYSTCARKQNGTLWCWGQAYSIGSNVGSAVPVQVGTRSDWIDIDAKFSHTCAIASDHTLWCFGHNEDGQLGQGDAELHVPPLQVPLPAAVDEVRASGFDTCARVAGRWWCWGRNQEGELGEGTFDDVFVPAPRCP
jgi:alpha-tubulin suppressor-like RCC1 family protein